jgi:hypothetical protein
MRLPGWVARVSNSAVWDDASNAAQRLSVRLFFVPRFPDTIKTSWSVMAHLRIVILPYLLLSA